MTITTNIGEGIVCPSPQGLSSLVHKKHFPQNIALAVTAITTSAASPTLSSLSRAAKSVLAFIVRLAECTDPTKPSWAFKATIAQEIGTSESTVYRGLNELVKSGLIERLRQERKSHNGRLFVSRLKLTKKACAYLGLFNTQCKRRYSPKSFGKEDTKKETRKTSNGISHQQKGGMTPEGMRTEVMPHAAPYTSSTPVMSLSEPSLSSENFVIDTIDTTISRDSTLSQQEKGIGTTRPSREASKVSVSTITCSASVAPIGDCVIDAARTALTACEQKEDRQCLRLLSSPQETLTAPFNNTICTESVEPKRTSLAVNQGRVIHKLPSVKLIDGINTLSSIDQKQSIKKQPGQPGTLSTKIANRRIPSDLAWLVQENCLSVTGLLHLMGTARKMGHFLSDIVKLRQSAIRPHTGRSLYAYLRALITKPVDYSYLRAQQDKERVARKQKATEKAHRETLIKDSIEKFRGRAFVSEEGTHYTFEDTHIYTKQLRNGLWYTGSFHAHHAYDLIKSIQSGRLREISVSEKFQPHGSESESHSVCESNSRFKKHLEKLRALLHMSVPQPAVS